MMLGGRKKQVLLCLLLTTALCSSVSSAEKTDSNKGGGVNHRSLRTSWRRAPYDTDHSPAHVASLLSNSPFSGRSRFGGGHRSRLSRNPMNVHELRDRFVSAFSSRLGPRSEPEIETRDFIERVRSRRHNETVEEDAPLSNYTEVEVQQQQQVNGGEEDPVVDDDEEEEEKEDSRSSLFDRLRNYMGAYPDSDREDSRFSIFDRLRNYMRDYPSGVPEERLARLRERFERMSPEQISSEISSHRRRVPRGIPAELRNTLRDLLKDRSVEGELRSTMRHVIGNSIPQDLTLGELFSRIEESGQDLSEEQLQRLQNFKVKCEENEIPMDEPLRSILVDRQYMPSGEMRAFFFPDEANDENSTSSRTRALRDRIRAFSRFKSARDSARETSSKRRFQILSKRWERLIEGEVRRIRRNQQLSENEKAVIIENIKERAAEVWKDALSEAPNATKLTRREFGLLRNFAKKLVQEAIQMDERREERETIAAEEIMKALYERLLTLDVTADQARAIVNDLDSKVKWMCDEGIDQEQILTELLDETALDLSALEKEEGEEEEKELPPPPPVHGFSGPVVRAFSGPPGGNSTSGNPMKTTHDGEEENIDMIPSMMNPNSTTDTN